MIPSGNFRLAILCGGKSSRMGSDKAQLRVHNQPLFIYQVNRLKELSLPIHLSVNQNQKFETDLPQIVDVNSEIGPMGAMKSVLQYDNNSNWLLLPVDMPNVSMSLLETIVKECSYTNRSVFCSVDDFVQPFPCVLTPAMLPELQSQVNRRHYKLLNIIDSEVSMVVDHSSRAMEFVNLNTEAEFADFINQL